MLNGNEGRRQIIFSLLLGGIVSALLYVLIFGVATLSVTYVDWIYARTAGEDEYLTQMTWELFRADDWRFPIGTMRNVLYGVKDGGGSLLFQGTNQLAPIVFKVFRSILPDKFQFIGIWQLFSFIMLGAFACSILMKYLRSLSVCVVLSQLFAFMPAMVYRSFYHSVLCSHWVVMLPIFIYVYKKDYFYNTRRQIIAWVTAMSLSILVYVYYVPMVGAAMVGFVLEDWLENRKTGKALLIIISSLASVLFWFWQLGGIGQIGDVHSAGGFGLYSANLLFLFDSDGFSSIVPDIPSCDDFYEGFAYLGISGIVLLACALIITLYRGALTNEWISNITKRKASIIAIVFVIGTTLFMAFGPRVYLSSKLLVDNTWCSIYMKVMSSFRSCGRVIWLCMYIVLFYAVITVFKPVKGKVLPLLLAIVLVVGQLYDLQPLFKAKVAREPAGIKYVNPHDTGFWVDISDIIEHVYRLSYKHWSTPGTLEIYCADNHLTLNNFYCPRNDDAANLANIDQGISAVMTGTLEKDTLYCIMDNVSFTDANMTGEDVVELHVDGYYVYIHKDLWDQLDHEKYQNIYMSNTGEYLDARNAYLAEHPGLST